MKKCTKCGECKPVSEFSKDPKGKYGLHSWCKECKRDYSKEYRKNNKEREKEYRKNNKERIKEYYESNKERIKEYGKKYHKNNYIRIWVNHTLYQHKKRGIIYSPIFFEYLLKKALEKPSCSICHRELEWYSTGKYKTTELSPTLDRINNDNYMDIDNVDIICHKCNTKKNSDTLEENLVWCKQFEEYANKKLRK